MSYLILINEESKPVLVEVPQKPEPTPISDNKEFEHKFRRNVDGLYDASLLAYNKLLESAISDKSKHIQFKDEESTMRIIRYNCLARPDLKIDVGQTFPLPTGYKVSFEGDFTKEKACRKCDCNFPSQHSRCDCPCHDIDEKFAILSKLEEEKTGVPKSRNRPAPPVVAPSEEAKQTHSSKLLHLALKIVADINQEFYESGYENYLTLTTDGNYYEIEYLGNRLMLSEEDMRDENDTLYDHLWKKIDEVNNEPKKCPKKVLE